MSASQLTQSVAWSWTSQLFKVSCKQSVKTLNERSKRPIIVTIKTAESESQLKFSYSVGMWVSAPAIGGQVVRSSESTTPPRVKAIGFEHLTCQVGLNLKSSF